MRKDITATRRKGAASIRATVATPPSLRLYQVYEPKTDEGRESRLSPPMTFHMRRALRKRTRGWAKPPGIIALWALREGLDSIEDQWQVSIIRDLVSKLDDAESDEILQLEDAGYKLLPRGGHMERMTLRNVWPDDVKRCQQLAEGLALRNANKTQPGTNIVAALAIVNGMVDHLGEGNIKRALEAERRLFFVWLNERFRLAADLVKEQRR
jgi:hypothetical protein